MSSLDENMNSGAEKTNGSFTSDNRDNGSIHSENKYDRSSEGRSYEYTNYRPPVNNGVYGNTYYSAAHTSDPPKKNSKGKKTVALAILIVVCMIMSSIGTAFMMSYLYEKGVLFGGTQQNIPGDTDNTINNNEIQGGVKEPVTITKNPGNKVEVIQGNVGDKNMSVAQISALVADSVVEITTSSVEYDIFYGQQIVSGAGSGVIIGKTEGDDNLYYIVTNHHVIDGAENISVRLRDGSEYVGKLIGSDIISDIGIVEITSDKKLTVAQLGNSDNLVVGEDIVVIGNPLGKLGGTVTDGIISALERKVNVEGLEMTLMQHNAAISPGNSGGGLFNTSGELVGIVNAKSNDSSAEGLGFAIPINYAYEIIDDILNFGYVTGRAALPFSVQEYSSSSMFGSTSTYMVVISKYDEIKFNDVLYSINDTKVSSSNGLISILSGCKAGETVTVQVARLVGRETKLFSYDITLVEYIPQSK